MDPRSPTRGELAKFFTDQRSLVAFERLFEKVGVGLPAAAESSALSAGNAEARATTALGLIQMLADLLDKAPPHAAKPDEWITPPVVTQEQDSYLPPVVVMPPDWQKQVAEPSATGFSVTALNRSRVWLLIRPAAAYAAGTIVLPASPKDNQTLTVSCTEQITTLTVDGNGNTVSGAPSALSADSHFLLRFDLNSGWHRGE